MDGSINKTRQITLTTIWSNMPRRDEHSETIQDEETFGNQHADGCSQQHNHDNNQEENTREHEDSNNEYDSLESDQEMASNNIPKKKKRKRIKKSNPWKPHRLPETEMHTDPICSDGYYIGDPGSAPNTTKDTIRIATTNINKNAWSKLDQEVVDWFMANELDALVLADSDFSNEETKIWLEQTDGTAKPTLTVFSAAKVAIMIDSARWESRVIKKEITRSPSGRSICIPMRLGSKGKLWLVGTYCHHTPQQFRTETESEWHWMETTRLTANLQGAFLIIGGDFNTYGTHPNDRPSRTVRNSASTRVGEQFEDWTRRMNMASAFRIRHPDAARYTLKRDKAGIRVTLDDIYVPVSLESRIIESGIWMQSLHASDHVGVPFTTIQLTTGEATPRQLHGVKAIKYVNTRTKSAKEMTEFTAHLEKTFDCGNAMLIDPLPPDPTYQQQCDWIECAIENLHKIMYKAGKDLWGEQDQNAKTKARAVCIRNSQRCHGYLKHLKSKTTEGNMTMDTTVQVANIPWPRWILEPNKIPETAAHRKSAKKLHDMWCSMTSSLPVNEFVDWIPRLWEQWQKVRRIRWDWRQRRTALKRENERNAHYEAHATGRFLQQTMKTRVPTLKITTAAKIDAEGNKVLTSDRNDVEKALKQMLDQWIPPEEQTQRPRHLDTWSRNDEVDLPQFIKEMVLPDLQGPDYVAEAFLENGQCTWDSYTYDQTMQQSCDRRLKKHVSPGYGGVSQEMWCAATPNIREREREIINRILRTGYTPTFLKRKQLVLLLKKAEGTTIVDLEHGIPPWRPIMVQVALSSRVFMVLRDYVGRRIPNNIMQFGFQKMRTSQDASIFCRLLQDWAEGNNSDLFLVSKDCEKCFDRIPAWVMDYVYRRLGVPAATRKLMIDFLAEGQVDIKTALGWLDGGKREFGLGQGSIMSVMHIGYYMDLLQEMQDKGQHGAIITHHQGANGKVTKEIRSLKYVDDDLDVATTYQGIQQRADITNLFTGKYGSGAVFGAAKSFMWYRSKTGRHYDAIKLNDGMGRPKAITVVAATEGFTHLGVQQGGKRLWAATMASAWSKTYNEIRRIGKKRLHRRQLQYIIKSVWQSRIKYRGTSAEIGEAAEAMDLVIRKTAKQAMHLPHATAKGAFHDTNQGLGIERCQEIVDRERLAAAIRILNTPLLPTRDLVLAGMEAFQIRYGLTTQPLESPIEPPANDKTWIASVVRAAANQIPKVSVVTIWNNPKEAQSSRSRDTPIWTILNAEESKTLMTLNKNQKYKIRYVGDVANIDGNIILPKESLMQRFRWNQKTYQQYRPILERIEVINGKLTVPVGRSRIDTTWAAQVPYAVNSLLLQARVTYTEDGELTQDDPKYIVVQRISERTETDEHGTQIEVIHWTKKYRDKPAWYAPPRKNDRAMVYTGNLLALDVDTVNYKSGRRIGQRAIIWTNDGGRNDPAMIDTVFQATKERFCNARDTGQASDVDVRCTGCKRMRETSFCTKCQLYHHAECVNDNCMTEDVSKWEIIRTSAARLFLSDGIARQSTAGDGSVLHGGTAFARGSWGLVQRSGKIVSGQLHISPKCITSTRCETHALLAGLVLNADTVQTCDNRAGITILDKARWLQKNRRQPKFSDKNRIELRSLMAHPSLKDFAGRWVASHKEGEFTDDQDLQEWRDTLAKADEIASAAHQCQMPLSYGTWLKLDGWQLVDHLDRPVFSNILRWLELQKEDRRWFQENCRKSESKQTIVQDATPMLDLCKWNPEMDRFYLRAICNVLHTNSVKHLMDTTWNPRCRICPLAPKDTQQHRFGLTDPVCLASTSLATALDQAFCTTIRNHMIPDQYVNIPRLAHEAAEHLGYPTQAIAKTDPEATINNKFKRKQHMVFEKWKPMINLCTDIWVNALHILRIYQLDTEIECVLNHLRYDLQGRKRWPSNGPLLPRRIHQTTLQCHPELASRHIRLSQWDGLGTGATFRGCFKPSKVPTPMESHSTWWIDDTNQPNTTTWWDDLFRSVTYRTPQQERVVLWAAVYEDTPGYRAMNKVGTDWLVSIPKGILKMGTDVTRAWNSQPTWDETATFNPATIWIGIWAINDDRNLSTLRNIWQHAAEPGWIVTTPSDVDQRSHAYAVHHEADTMAWHPRPLSTLDDQASFCHDWLRMEHSNLYEAPNAQRLMTSASASTWQWINDVCYQTQTRSMHRNLLINLWTALRQHWRTACQANITAIDAAGETAALQATNRRIKHKRSTHAARPPRLQNSITTQLTRNAVKTTSWKTQRAAHLQPSPLVPRPPAT